MDIYISTETTEEGHIVVIGHCPSCDFIKEAYVYPPADDSLARASVISAVRVHMRDEHGIPLDGN